MENIIILLLSALLAVSNTWKSAIDCEELTLQCAESGSQMTNESENTSSNSSESATN